MKSYCRLLLACCLMLSGTIPGYTANSATDGAGNGRATAAQTTQTAEFYVSPKGKDSNRGTKDSPWKTAGHAQQAVRTLRSASPDVAVTVYFREGCYPMDAPLQFTAADSGTEQAPVVYAAAPGEKPLFTGSAELKTWRKVTDKAILARLDPAVRNQIYVADLRKAGITDFGDPAAPGKRPELFCNGELQTLARWPNSGFAYAGKMLGKTPAPANWANFEGTVEGVFEYTDPRQNRWAAEADVRLNGYWFWDWFEDYQKIERLDTLKQIIYLQTPEQATYGYKNGLRYRGLNLLCELDTPGEWYIDRASGLIYWYPSVGAAYDNRVTLTRFDAPFMVEMTDCSFITLRGLTFEESRGSGISITGGGQCRLDGLRIAGMGRDGMNITGGRNHAVTGCLLETLGFSGIQLAGGDRKTLSPAGYRIENSVVRNFSTFKRTYEPAIHAAGCGFYIAHNRFEHSSSSAMRYEGNDIVVEYNEIRDVVNESDDQGGIESYYNPTYRGIVIRYNRWSDIFGGTFSGATGVRTDDMICGVEVYGNIFERCGSHSFGGVQINGGKENVIENNLFYRCPAAVSFTSMWTPEKWTAHLDTVTVVRQKLYEEVDINSAVYRQKYPELQRLHEDFNRNTIKDNLVVDCPELLITGHDGNTDNNARQTLENNTMIQSDGKSIRELTAPEFLARYRLKPIPLAQMGPQHNPWVK